MQNIKRLLWELCEWKYILFLRIALFVVAYLGLTGIDFKVMADESLLKFIGISIVLGLFSFIYSYPSYHNFRKKKYMFGDFFFFFVGVFSLIWILLGALSINN